jgi:hypothetical protein
MTPRSWLQSLSQPQVALLTLRLAAGFQLLLMAATWKLWLIPGSFPLVPLLSLHLRPQLIPAASIPLAAGCLLLTLNATPRSRLQKRIVLLTLLAAALPVLCSLQCLQAWHWLFMLTLLLTLLPLPTSNLRAVIAALYVCSGLSRFSLAPEVGPVGLIVRQLLLFAGRPDADPATVRLCCHLACVAEILAGLALLFAGRLPQLAAAAAAVMHLSLLAALGPFGLGHHPAVLIWNLQLLLLSPLLALTAPRWTFNVRGISAALRCSLPAALHWLFALSGLFGLADNWPSWQLYSSRPESWQLWIRRDHAHRLPDSLQPWLSPAVVNGWQPLSLDRLSLAATSSPLVPEDRFQAAIIEAILQDIPNDTDFHIRITEPDPLRWWQRSERQISTRQQLRQEQTGFLLNATAIR